MRRVQRTALLLLILAVPAIGKAQDYTLPGDSSRAADKQSLYYEVARERLILWLKQHYDRFDRNMLQPVIELVQDAQKFAAGGDLQTALLLLDTATEVVADLDSLGGEQKPSTPPAADAAASAGWTWEPQVITGVDLWRQEFEVGFSTGADTTFLETANNPFWGIRLRGNFDRQGGGYFESFATARLSRDYYSADLQLRNLQGRVQSTHLLMDNRTQWTRYRTGLDLNFWENKTTIQSGIAVAKGLVLLLGDDLRVRRYKQDGALYPDYLQNQVYGGLQHTSGLSSRLAAMYTFASRRHPEFRQDDFVEHRIDASAYQVTAVNSSIYIENIWRQRRYLHGDSDSTYQNSFSEEFLRTDLRFGLTPAFSFDFQGEFTLRQHRVKSLITPDFLHLQANPRLLIRLWGDWQLGLGYLFVLRIHSKDIVQTSPVLSVTAADTQIGYEDYYSHGFSLSLELFKMGAFMLSLNNLFEYRTYPNSPTQNVPGFGLFTDRNINSLMVFLTWQLRSNLELNLIANMDDDRSRFENHTDTRSQLITLDLGYSF